MPINESLVKNSFRAVKGDILKLEGELMNIQAQQSKIIVELENLKKPKTKPKVKTKTRVITKTIRKTPRKRYIASKEGNRFHDIHCPFAKNIKPKTRVVFKSKASALNKGYKPCSCVR